MSRETSPALLSPTITEPQEPQNDSQVQQTSEEPTKEQSSTVLFISQTPQTTTESQIRDLLSPYGTIEKICLFI